MAAVLAVSVAVGPPIAGAVDAGAGHVQLGDASTTADRPDIVTLISGDRVIITEGLPLQVLAAAGRDHVTFLTEERDGDQYVIPADAVPLLAAGTIDHDLFNISRLREFGYTDSVPVIVTTDPAAPTASSGMAAQGTRITGRFPVVDSLAVDVDPHADRGLWHDLTSGRASGVERVALDGLLTPTLADSVPMIGAPAAWDVGLDGTGTTVAVLDTGADDAHPDLAEAIVDSRNFTDEEDGDLVGHGTHVASTIAGSGALSDGRNRGVAPGADLIVGKVCQQDGCPRSAILAGMQWAAEQGADVVNMSLGGPEPVGGPDILAEAVNQLTAQYGTLFVVAAGNSAAERTVESPGTADAALTVAAVDKDDQPAGFSSKGPRGDGALKPDIAAPGVGIVAAIPGEQYGPADGTSMATPHVAGAAAILAQQRPDASPDQLKAALMASVDRVTDAPPHVQGNGRVDVARAISQTVTAEPASVSFARQVWPHDESVDETVTYRNDGDSDVTLTLAVSATAPADLFSVSDAQVVVPAGGSASVTVTVDPPDPDMSGYFGGHLTATTEDGSTVVTTGFGVDLEEESYDVTFVHTGRDGEPTSSYRTVLAGPLDQLGTTDVADQDPEVTLRMPAGRYVLYSWIDRIDPATGK